MINFNGDSIWNLKPLDVSAVKTQVFGLLIEGEEIVAAFRTIRDQLVFTNKRIISIDVQGLTGLKKSFAIMPYSRVQFFTIQTPGFAELVSDSELLSDVLQRLHREIRVPRQRRHRRPRPHHLHLRPVSPVKQSPRLALPAGDLYFCVKKLEKRLINDQPLFWYAGRDSNPRPTGS